EQHLNTCCDSPTRGFRTVARRKLLKGDDGEGRRNDPTVGSGSPGPAKLVRIDGGLLVCKLEFPTPQPVCFMTSDCNEPTNGTLGRTPRAAGNADSHKTKSGRPGTFFVSNKRGPTAVPVLPFDQRFGPCHLGTSRPGGQSKSG